MTFIDDNGNQLEFGGEFAMTKQAVSFFNGSIKGDVSINFSVDNNSVNRKVLGYYGAQMVNQVAWTKQAFNRVRNGNILDRGYIVIQNEDGDKLSCFYVSGNSNWVQSLNGLINQLDYTGVTNGTDYNTLLTASNVTTKATATDGIIFPIVDWINGLGKGDNNYYQFSIKDVTNDRSIVNLFEFYPCLYLHTLVSEIAKQNGLKISGDLIDDPIYKSIIISPSNGQMKRQSFKNVVLVGSAQSFASGVTQKYTSFTETQDPDSLFSNNSYTANKKASLYFNLTNSVRTGAGISTVSIYKNGVSVSSTAWVYDGYRFRSSIINCNYGDVFDVYVTNSVGPTYSATLNLVIETPEVIGIGDYVNPSHFLPSLSCIDPVKFVINYFGCSSYFNNYSKTINCNIIENIKTETALDWSEYYVSHRSEYTVNQAQNNYIRLADNNGDSFIDNYNSSHLVKYGEGNITTGNTLKKDNELIKLPFSPSSFGMSKGLIYQSNIPLVNLIDDGEPIPFTGISGGIFTFAVTTLKPNFDYSIVRVSNSTGVNQGYFIIYNPGIPSDPDDVYTTYNPSATDSGNFWLQKVNYQNVGARFLTVKPSTSIGDFSDNSSITLWDEEYNTSTVSSLPLAIFTKPAIGDTIDQWKNNLAIDNPDSGGFTDPTIKQLYFNKISKFLQNPNIRCKMLLPEAVYQSFVFDQFIYLRTENLTGYFFVDSIVNYIDGNTPVEVNLLML